MSGRMTIVLAVFLCITATALIYSYASEKETGAAPDKRIARGKQLVIEGNCDYCHTPLIETKEGPVPDMKRRLSGRPRDMEMPRMPAGGTGSPEWMEFLGTLDSTEWAGPWGLVFSKNITPDPETGIGKWTEDIFVETIRTGRHIDFKRDLLPPMPWRDYGMLGDEDLKSIFAYLMTVPPVKNAVPKPIPLSEN
jgi:mono/diheme cytochrome c family protein